MISKNKILKDNLQKEVNLLATLYNSKKLDLAETKGNELVKKFPNVAVLLNIVGLVAVDKNKLNDAIIYFKRAIICNENFSVAYNNLANVYKKQNQKDLAITNYKISIDKDPKNSLAYNNLANLYKSENKIIKAIQIYKESIEINPNNHIILNNLGIAYKILGLFEDAKKCFLKAIKIKPDFYFAYRNLDQITKWKKNDNILEVLKKSYLKIKNNNETKRELAFTLAKASDDIKDYESAYNFYTEGNKIAKKIYNNYSIEDDKKLFRLIAEKFNLQTFKKFKNRNSKSKNLPIFIVGMPRSGTTLVEQILSKHNKIYAVGETEIVKEIIESFFTDKKEDFLLKKDFDYTLDHLDRAGSKYIKILENRAITNILGLSNKDSINQKDLPFYLTDKLPTNFKWIGLIKLILPEAKIIHCTRSSKDVCFSIFKNFFAHSGIGFAYSFEDIINFYNLYNGIMDHWNKVLPNFIYKINYESLLNSPEKEIGMMLKYLNLDWEKECINFYTSKRAVYTLSQMQVRKPFYKDSINSWKNYEKYLPSLFNNLSD
jgi:Tfp pilus assembly protein PilF